MGATDTTLPATPRAREARSAPPIEAPALPPGATALPRLDPEAYAVGREVARGGMGRVVRAVDRRLGRVVALKQLIDSTPRRRERFAREAQITARLQHPSIVPVYEAGWLEGGGLTYSMKLVSGEALEDAIARATTLADRLALLPRLIDVVDAVAYAHSQGVIHRDIKPSNIVLGEFGESVLIDWGVAKVVEDAAAGDDGESPGGGAAAGPAPAEVAPDPPPSPVVRAAGAGAGEGENSDAGADDDDAPRSVTATRTSDDLPPASMAPTGRAEDGGLTLPGSIVGTPAYMAPEQAAGEPIDERADVYALGAMLYHLLAGHHPYRGADSTAIVARLISGPPPLLESAEPRVPAELAAVVARAMSRAPASRYRAAELAAELRRFTTGQLVAAYRYTARERAARWIRRHRAAVAVAGTALLVLAAGAALSAHRIVGERDRAEDARADAERARAEAESRADQLTLGQARTQNSTRRALELLSQLSPGAPEWRGARVVAADAASRSVPRAIGMTPLPLRVFRYLPDGSLLTATADRARVWQPRTGAHRDIPLGQLIELSGDGTAALARLGDRLVRIDVASGKSVPIAAAPAGVKTAAISFDGRQVALATADTTYLWTEPGTDPGTEPLRALGPAPTRGVLRFTPPGDMLLAVTDMDLPDGRAVPEGIGPGLGGWSLPAGTWTAISRMDFVTPGFLEVSPDGKRVATLSPHGALYTLGTHDLVFSVFAMAHILPGTPGGVASVTHLAFSADSKHVVMSDSMNGIRVAGVGMSDTTIASRDAEVTAVAYLPDSSGVLASGRDATAILWRIGWVFYRSFWHPRAVVNLAAAPDSRSFATVTSNGVIRVFDLPPERQRLWPAPVLRAALASDGSGAFVPGGRPGVVVRWTAKGAGEEIGHCDGDAGFTQLAAVPGVVAALCKGRSWRWREGTGAEATPAASDRTTGPDVTALALSPSGSLLTWSADGAVALDRHPVSVVKPAGALAALSGGGTRAALAQGSDLAIVDLEHRAVTRVALGGEKIVALALSSDGRHIAAARADGEITMLDPRGRQAGELTGLSVPATALALSPDGATLVSGAGDRSVAVWDTSGGAHRWINGHRGPVLSVAASKGRIWSADRETVRENPDDLPADEAGLRRWIAAALRQPFTPPAAPGPRAAPAAPGMLH